MPELDSLRGVAVLLVLIFHGFSFPATVSKFSGVSRLFVAATAGGWTGVNLFFVLSGFLITGILFDSTSRPDYYSRSTFAGRSEYCPRSICSCYYSRYYREPACSNNATWVGRSLR